MLVSYACIICVPCIYLHECVYDAGLRIYAFICFVKENEQSLVG